MSTVPLDFAGSSAQYKVQSKLVAATSLVVSVVGANPNRVCIMFSDNAGNIFISANLTVLTGNNQGEIFIPSQSPTQTYEYAKYGPYVQQAFSCQRVSGISNLVVTEIIYVPTG